jgi:uncharacterized protein
VTAWYLDASAIVKLVVAEAESDALVRWRSALDPEDRLVTAELSLVEVPRAVGRAGGDLAAAGIHLDSLDHVVLDRELLRDAGVLPPTDLRSLAAVHLAAARLLGGALGGVVTYDVRMADRARDLGMVVLAPA